MQLKNNDPLDNFNTSNVTNVSCMFYGATSFNKPLDNFNTRKVTSMFGMFNGTISLFIGYRMRFVAKAICVIQYIHDITDHVQIESAIDGFIIY